MDEHDSFGDIENVALASSKAHDRLDHMKYNLRGGSLDPERYRMLKPAIEMQRDFLERRGFSGPELDLAMEESEARATAWLSSRGIDELRGHLAHQRQRVRPPLRTKYILWDFLASEMNDIVLREDSSPDRGCYFYDRARKTIVDLPFIIFSHFPNSDGRYQRENEQGEPVGRTLVSERALIHMGTGCEIIARIPIQSAGDLSPPMMKAIHRRLIQRILAGQQGDTLASSADQALEKVAKQAHSYLQLCGPDQLRNLQRAEIRLQEAGRGE